MANPLTFVAEKKIYERSLNTKDRNNRHTLFALEF